MTRLRTEDIRSISADLIKYDRELMGKTGCPLGGIACRAAGVDPNEIQKIAGGHSVGVIPFTSGEGIIKGFCEAVKDIVSHLGCRAFVTRAADVTGLAEAFDKKADIVMAADDKCFVALDLHSRRAIDNAIATGSGFVAGLSLMAGGVDKKNVLVLGCGSVGGSAAEALIRCGARVSVYDTNFSRCHALAEALKESFQTEIQIEKDLEAALARHRYIVEATPAEDIIPAHHITPNTYIGAPGVPIGLGREARQKIGPRLLHDPLQIGVATMIVCALKYHLPEKIGLTKELNRIHSD